MNYVYCQGEKYPEFQARGNAAKYIMPMALEYCEGEGVDVGFGKPEWQMPNSIGADLADDSNEYDAYCLPTDLDYVFSSHCLEHLVSWVRAISFWATCLKQGGTMFLYLPHPDQVYWRPWNNPKHKHILHPQDVENCMKFYGLGTTTVTGIDLNHSFAITGTKL